MSFFKNCLKGIGIGAGAILPGVSSGILCVIFGIYEKLLDSILNFFKDIKNNFSFLFPIMLGSFIVILLFSNILNSLFYSFPLETKSIFIGLILGSIPSLLRDINKKSGFKLHYLLYSLLAFCIGLFSVFLENNMTFINTHNISSLYLFLAGFVMSIGVVVPGVSSTIILMIFGVYSTYLASVSALYLPVLVPMGLGLILGGIIFMKITKYLLENFHVQTFYTIIGFTFGSIFVLLPDINSIVSGLICILCIFLSFLILKLFKI